MSEFFGYSNDSEIYEEYKYDNIFDIANDAEEFNKLIRKEGLKNLIIEHVKEFKKLEEKINELNFEDYFSE